MRSHRHSLGRRVIQSCAKRMSVSTTSMAATMPVSNMLCRPDAVPERFRRRRRSKAECIGQRIVHADDGAHLAAVRLRPCRQDLDAERLGRDRWSSAAGTGSPPSRPARLQPRVASRRCSHPPVAHGVSRPARWSAGRNVPVCFHAVPRCEWRPEETTIRARLARPQRAHGLREHLLAQQIAPHCRRIDQARIDDQEMRRRPDATGTVAPESAFDASSMLMRACARAPMARSAFQSAGE